MSSVPTIAPSQSGLTYRPEINLFEILEYDMKKIVVYVKPGYIESLKAQDITQSNFYVKNPICENWDFFDF